MAVIAITSVRGAPGVTTLAVELVRRWPGAPPTMIEADPDGGCLAAREGLRTSPGLAELAAAARTAFSVEALDEVAQPLPPRGTCVVAPASPDHVELALRAGAATVAAALAGAHARTTIVDAGRLRPASPSFPFVTAADVVLVMVSPALDALAGLRHRAPLLAELPVGVVLSSTSPYDPTEIAQETGFDVIATLPRSHDRRTRRQLADALDALARNLDAVVGGGDDGAPPVTKAAR